MAPQLDVFTKQTVRARDGSRVTRAQSELARAIEFFTNRKHFRRNRKLTNKSFGFAVYQDRELRKALETMFGSKCAYCESRVAHVLPRDVEHFRPKSEIGERAPNTIAPGYFWLAGEWTNLLVSCIDCNRARAHEVPGQPAKLRLGKHTQFPLRDESARVRSHKISVAAEEPVRLLLDPCADDPEQHLTFDDEGLVRPRLNSAGQPSDMGEVSIYVYALQRKELVEERKRVLNDVIKQIDALRGLVRTLGALKRTKAAKRDREDQLQQIQAAKARLASMTAQDAEFAAMVRDYIRRTRDAGGFDDLRKNGIDLGDLLTKL
jgi:uncharacterized protein (TIGR02646 family)